MRKQTTNPSQNQFTERSLERYVGKASAYIKAKKYPISMNWSCFSRENYNKLQYNQSNSLKAIAFNLNFM